MRDLIFPIFLLALAAASPFAVAKGGGLHGSYSAATHRKTAPWVHRDSHGKIARDTRQTGRSRNSVRAPATGKSYGSCTGYVIDHVIPLKRGGLDAPSNMQWRTEAAVKQKDKWE